MDHRRRAGVAGLIAVLSLAGAAAAQPGLEAVTRNCTACHAREQLLRAPRCEAAWRETVARMSSHRQRISGEGLPVQEQEAVAAYLSAAVRP